MIDFLEFEISGLDTSSVVSAFQVVRSSGTIAATPTALSSPNSDGPMVPATAPLSNLPQSFVAATTKPQASLTITDGKINLGLKHLRWHHPLERCSNAAMAVSWAGYWLRLYDSIQLLCQRWL